MIKSFSPDCLLYWKFFSTSRHGYLVNRFFVSKFITSVLFFIVVYPFQLYVVSIERDFPESYRAFSTFFSITVMCREVGKKLSRQRKIPILSMSQLFHQTALH